ncbi:MAG: GTP 3',8-cyclase MoaA, partial [Planctomycetota bacterium]
LRLTSDGRIKPCLYSTHDYDVKQFVRGGASDEQVRNLLVKIIAQKHTFTRLNASSKEFSMWKIGG